MESNCVNEVCVSQKPKFTVLVEEMKGTRLVWKRIFAKRGWGLEVFGNPLEFLEQLDRFRGRSERIEFFFDQDFGRVRGVGVQLARAVQGLNADQTVSLVTNYDRRDFHSELNSLLIDDVFDKFPKPFFGSDGHSWLVDRKLSAEYWASCFDNQCARDLECSLGYDGHQVEFTLEEHFPSRAPKPVPVVSPEPLLPVCDPVIQSEAVPSRTVLSRLRAVIAGLIRWIGDLGSRDARSYDGGIQQNRGIPYWEMNPVERHWRLGHGVPSLNFHSHL